MIVAGYGAITSMSGAIALNTGQVVRFPGYG